MKPQDLLFAKTHEWLHLDRGAAGGPLATVGISHVAVEALTDLVFLELPEVGRQVKAGESIGEIESVKAVSDLYSPAGGEIVEVNAGLPDRLSLLNDDPYGAAWIVKIRVSDAAPLADLMNYDAYQKSCAEEH